MYILKRSYVFDTYFGEWEQKDLSLFKISEIMKYDDFKLIVAMANDPDKEWAFMKDMIGEYVTDFTSRFSVSVWLSTFQEDTLARSDRPVALRDIQYVEYKELFRSGAYVEGVRVQGNDLALRPRRTDEQKYGRWYFRNNCLLVVNRRVFRFDDLLDEIYIYNAQDRLSEVPNEHCLGFIDFARVGGCQALAIREDQVTDLTNDLDRQNNNYRFRIILDEGITGKTPFISIAGHLYLMDGNIFQADAKTFVITVSAEKLIERLLEDKKSKERLAYVFNANIREGGMRIDTLDIAKLMADSWSFFGWINSNKLLTRREEISRSNTESMYQHYRMPKGIMYYEDGELAQPRIFNYNQYLCSMIVPYSRSRWHMTDTIDWDETKAKTKTGYNDSRPLERNLYVKDIYFF